MRKTLLLAFFLSVVLPVAVVQLLTLTQVREHARDAFLQSVEGEVRQIDNAFTLLFQQIEKSTAYLASLETAQINVGNLPRFFDSEGIQSIEPSKLGEENAALYSLFSHFAASHDDLAYIYMGDENGGYLQWPAGPLTEQYDPRGRPWYLKGLSGEGVALRTNAYYWAADDATTFSTVIRLNNKNGNNVGVLGVDLSVTNLTSLVKDIKYGETGYLMVVESNMNVLVDANNSANNFRPLQQINSGAFADLSAQLDGHYDLLIEGVPYLANIYTSPVLGWRMIGLIKASEVEAASDSLMRATLLTTLVSLVVFVSLATILSTSISARIQSKHSELTAARKQADLANEAKSNFLSTVSHEIRTPLNGIIGMAQLVSDSALSPLQEQKIETIVASGNTLLAIINDVLDMSKIEADALEVEETAFSLKNVFAGATAPFAMQAAEKGVRLHEAPLPTKFDTLVGDPVRLRQIIWNLISNALKFTSEGAVSIEINFLHSGLGESAAANMVNLELTVTDTGAGISTERLSNIFDPFVQEDNTITRKFGGTGLGLAIVKRLVALMDGEISVESQLGEGSCFRVLLPFRVAKETEIKSLRSRANLIEKTVGKGLKVLVAEDNPVNATIAKSFLEKFGCTVEVAINGKLAVEAFEATKFDFIFMDVHMPEMDGLEATQRIRTSGAGRSVPIIGLTADVFEEHHNKFMAKGMNGVVTKPFTEDQLHTALVRFTISAYSDEGAKADVPTPFKAELKPAPNDNLLEIPIGDPMVLSRLAEQVGTDTVQSLLTLGAKDLLKHCTTLRESLSSGEPHEKQPAAILHTIKGSVSALGALRLAAAAKTLEKDASDTAKILAALPDFDETVQETISWWQDRLNALGD